MSEVAANESEPEIKPGFFDELSSFWGALPERAAFLLLAVAWVLLFSLFGNSTFGYVDTGSLFSWMYTAYNAPMSRIATGT